jgi:carbamoyl-phosphate synthase large subunit
MKFRILITGAGTTTAITTLKGLRAADDPGIHIVMGDMKADCAGAHLGDEFVLMPPATAPDFVERVIDLSRDRRIDLVIPIIDYEFMGWAQAAGRLAEAGTQVAISPAPVLRTCEEKDETFWYFRSLGIPTITTWRAEEIVDASSLPFPVHLKPRCGRASLDNYKAQSLEEYEFYIKKVPDAIVQPFVRGTEVTIDTMSDLRGRFLAASPRIRVEVKSGQAYRSRTIEDPRLAEMARRIVEGLPIHGPSNIQCFMTDSGPLFFEINARFGAGSILSIRAGLNGPLALVAMVQGHALPDLTPRPGLMMLRYWQEVFTPLAH